MAITQYYYSNIFITLLYFWDSLVLVSCVSSCVSSCVTLDRTHYHAWCACKECSIIGYTESNSGEYIMMEEVLQNEDCTRYEFHIQFSSSYVIVHHIIIKICVVHVVNIYLLHTCRPDNNNSTVNVKFNTKLLTHPQKIIKCYQEFIIGSSVKSPFVVRYVDFKKYVTNLALFPFIQSFPLLTLFSPLITILSNTFLPLLFLIFSKVWSWLCSGNGRYWGHITYWFV